MKLQAALKGAVQSWGNGRRRYRGRKGRGVARRRWSL